MRPVFASLMLAVALALSWPAAALECPAANCEGLQNPTMVKGPVGTYHPRYNWRPNANNLTLDLRQATLLSEESGAADEHNPLHVYDGNYTGLYTIGGRIIGQQSRTLTYIQVKNNFDGNGVTVHGPGVSTIEGMY